MKQQLAGGLAMLALVACAPGTTPATGTTPAPAATAAVSAPATATRAPIAPPVTQIEIADGVTVTIHRADLAPGVRGWTLVTDGVAAAHDHELVLALAARPYDSIGSVPTDAVDLLRDVVTARGLRLAPWTIVQWTEGVLQRADLTGLLTIPVVAANPELALPPDALSLLVVTSVELEAAKRYGVPRVAAMLAHQLGHDDGAWVDLERSSVLTRGQMTESLWWARLPTTLPGMTARLDGSPGAPRAGTWIVRVTPEAAAQLAEQLREKPRAFEAYAIRPDPAADARFVWRPERDGFELVVATSARTQPTVSLIGFGAHRRIHGARLIEDGLEIYVSHGQRVALIAALVSGDDLSVETPSAGFMPWRLEWVRP